MNHELLEKWNYHITMGDILLLTSRGAESVAIKAYQSSKRGLPAKYTHVAIVISPDMIVDAMPKSGVGFRQWADMEADYDVENCCVARNAKLASNPDAPKLLYQRATYYYRQPYKLRALLSPPEAYTDQAGLVCSQFVALLLLDAGVNASVQSVLETLPVDIDTATRTLPDWRQFPMMEYGLYSKCAKPRDSTAYREDLLRASPIRLSAEDEEEAKRIAEKFFDKGVVQGVNEFMSSTDRLLAEADKLRREVNDALSSATEDAYTASRLVQQFDDMTVRLMGFMAEKPSHRDLSALAAQIQDSLPSDGPAFGGARLLSIWRGLFINSDDTKPIFMHGERAPANHIERCALFRKSLATAKSIVDSNLKHFEQLKTNINDLKTFAEHGVLNREVLWSVREFAEHLLRGGEFLSGESPEEVQQRIDDFEALLAELKAWLASSDIDPRVKEDAGECLLAVRELDLERQYWLTSMQPALASIVKMVQVEKELDQPRNSSPDHAKNS